MDAASLPACDMSRTRSSPAEPFSRRINSHERESAFLPAGETDSMTDIPSTGRRVKAQVLSGFRDQLPAQMLLRRTLIERFRAIFEAHGFEPIDTPTSSTSKS